MRQSVVAPRTISPDGANGLAELLNEFDVKVKNGVKEVQTELQVRPFYCFDESTQKDGYSKSFFKLIY